MSAEEAEVKKPEKEEPPERHGERDSSATPASDKAQLLANQNTSVEQRNSSEQETVRVKETGAAHLKAVEVQSGNGQVLTLDAKGLPIKVTENGKEWISKDGKTFSSGKDSKVLVTDKDGVSFLADPKQELASANGRAPAKETLDEAALMRDAVAIHKLADADYKLFRWADKDGINKILEGKSDAERLKIGELYEKKYGIKLEDEIKKFKSGSDLELFESIYRRKDANHELQGARRIHTALTENQNMWSGRSSSVIEKDIRDTLSTKTPQQLAKMNEEFKQQYGISLKDAIANDKKLSQTTKDMANVYFDGKRDDADTAKLIDIALKSGNSTIRLDAFKEAMRDASDDARKKFLDNGGEKRIKDAFGQGLLGIAMDVALGGPILAASIYAKHDRAITEATDYARGGKLDVATQVKENTGFVFSNKEAVELAIKRMTETERQQYVVGKSLTAGSKVEGLTVPEQEKAKAFYDKLHGALTNVANASELLKFEGMIANKGEASFVDSLASHRGKLWNSSTAEISKDIDNMSKKDWLDAKANPQRREQLEAMLNSLNKSSSDIAGLLDRYDKIMSAESYEKLSQSKDITRMLDTLPRSFMGSAEEGEIKADTRDTVRAVEKELRDNPNLREQLLRPQTEEDRKLSESFQKSLKDALGSDFENFGKPLLEDGRLSLQRKMNMNQGLFGADPKEAFKDIADATPEERSKLLTDSKYQEKMLGSLSKENLKVALKVAEQGDVRPEDKIYSAIKGWGGSSEIVQELKGIKPEELNRVREAYTRKYGSSFDGDLMDKLGGKDRTEAQRVLTQNLSVETRADIARTNTGDARSGVGAWLSDNLWRSGTGSQTDDALDQANRAMAQKNALDEAIRTGSELVSNLTPEQQGFIQQQVSKQLSASIELQNKATDLHVNAKAEAGEYVGDAALATVAIGSMILTGGVDAPLVMGLAFAGAGIKVGSNAAMAGNNYDWSVGHVAKDGFIGSVIAATAAVGPGQIAAIFRIGASAAKESASLTMNVLAEKGLSSVIKEGGHELLENGTKNIIRDTLASNASKLDEAAFKSLADRVVAESVTGAERESAIALIAEQLRQNAAERMASGVVRMAYAQGLNSAGGGLGGGAGGFAQGTLNWDGTKTVSENLKMIATSVEQGLVTGAIAGSVTTVAISGGKNILQTIRGGIKGEDSGAAAVLSKETGPNGKVSAVERAAEAERPNSAETRIVQDTPKKVEPANEATPKLDESTKASELPKEPAPNAKELARVETQEPKLDSTLAPDKRTYTARPVTPDYDFRINEAPFPDGSTVSYGWENHNGIWRANKIVDSKTSQTFERVPGTDNKWTVREANGETRMLAGDIDVSHNGAYKIRNESFNPAESFSKTYTGPSGETWSPKPGSVFERDRLRGEFWTSPEGHKTWVDNKGIIWQNTGDKYSWSSAQGTFKENPLGGGRWDWNDGRSEIITPEGMGALHDPKTMAAGEWRTEDGGLFTQQTKPPDSLNVKAVTPDAFAGTSKYSKEYFQAPPDAKHVGNSAGWDKWRTVDGVEYTANKELGVMSRKGADGKEVYLDDKGRSWERVVEPDGSPTYKWANENGIYESSPETKGRRWTWKDGSADWIDNQNRVWHRTSDMPEGEWKARDGSIIKEGTLKYEYKWVGSTAPIVIPTGGIVGASQLGSQTAGATQTGEGRKTDARGKGLDQGEKAVDQVKASSVSAGDTPIASSRIEAPKYEVVEHGGGKSAHAQQLKEGTKIEGLPEAKKGDWLVTNENGEVKLVPTDQFNKLYKAVDKPVESPTFEFQKAATVKAEVSKEPFDWKDWQGNTMRAEAGDVRVTQPDGSITSVKPDIFQQTYSEVPGKPGEFAKTAITKAQQLDKDTAVNTLEGIGTGKKGDWLVTGPKGEKYIIRSEEFNKLYMSIEKPIDTPTFEFQKTATVRAEVSKEPFDWKDWQGNMMHAEAGDIKVIQPDGSTSSVKPDIFQQTYSEAPDKPGEFIKTAITRAQQLDRDTAVNTLEGVGTGKKGDYLVTGPQGEKYFVHGELFNKMYKQVSTAPVHLELTSPKESFIKTATVKAEMVNEDGFKWTNHDALAGQQEQIANKGDFKIFPADGGPFYVADGKFFREAYHDMPGFPGQYAKSVTLEAQRLESAATVKHPQQGVTSGNKGDYLVTDNKGNQYIVPKQTFEAQYAAQHRGQGGPIEPMSIPPETSLPTEMGSGVLHSRWDKGDIIRDTEGKTVLVRNEQTGEYKLYREGRLAEQLRVVDSPEGKKTVFEKYPYEDIESVGKLPSPKDYNEALLATDYQGRALRDVKEEAMSMPDTLKDSSINRVERSKLQQAAVEDRWNKLLAGKDETAEKLDFGPPKQEKQARILMGLTGSGKTTAGMSDLKGKGYMVLESDELKPYFPEYKAGVGATALRNESNQLNDELLKRAIEGNYNFVLPGVGTNAKWMKETIQALHDAGWKVDLVFVDIPPAESMTRVVSRFKSEGRFVDPGFLVTHGHVPAENFKEVVNDTFINGRGLNSYRHVWNYGRTPIVLQEGKL